MTDIRLWFAEQGLVRSDRRVLGGVCAGLGERFGLGKWTARLLFVLLLMVIPGSQILVYPVLWILMPSTDGLRYREWLAEQRATERQAEAVSTSGSA